MGYALRDAQRSTYADYCTWPGDARYDQTVKLAAYGQAGVPEYWLVRPLDRILTIYRLDGAAYGRPQVAELVGETPVGVLPGVDVAWAPIVARLLPPD